MSIEFNTSGPLRNADLKKSNDCTFWDKTRPGDIAAQPDDVPYTVKIGDRLDLLASTKLADAGRGWIILLRNSLRLWPNDFVPGLKVMIPTIDSLKRHGII